MGPHILGSTLLLTAALALHGGAPYRGPQGSRPQSAPAQPFPTDAASAEKAASWARESLRARLDESRQGKAIAFTLETPSEITIPVSARFCAWNAASEGAEMHLLCDGKEATIDVAKFTAVAGGSVERRMIAPDVAATFLLRGAAFASAKAQPRRANGGSYTSTSHALTAFFTLEWTPPGAAVPSTITLGPALALRFPSHAEDVTSPSLELLHREVQFLSASSAVAPAEEATKAVESARARARLVLDDPAEKRATVRFYAQLLSEIGVPEDDIRLSRLVGKFDDDVVEGARVALELRGLAAPERPERVRQVFSKNGHTARLRTRAYLRNQVGSEAADWLAPLLESSLFRRLGEEPRRDALAAFLEALPGADELAQPLPPELRAGGQAILDAARAVADRWYESQRVRLRAKSLLH